MNTQREPDHHEIADFAEHRPERLPRGLDPDEDGEHQRRDAL